MTTFFLTEGSGWATHGKEDAKAANVDHAKQNVANVFLVSDALSCFKKYYGNFYTVIQTFLLVF